MSKLKLLTLIGIVLVSCNTTVQEERALWDIPPQELIKRGEYLIAVGGCHDCHSPKKMTQFGPIPDPDRLLSGHPADFPLGKIDKTVLNDWVLFGPHNTSAVGPWGVSFAGNITSDPTGIGNWSFDQFKVAMTKGKFKGIEAARDLLPPMPWPNFQQMTDEDLFAIYSYLKTTSPIQNVPPAPIPPADL